MGGNSKDKNNLLHKNNHARGNVTCGRTDLANDAYMHMGDNSSSFILLG